MIRSATQRPPAVGLHVFGSLIKLNIAEQELPSRILYDFDNNRVIHHRSNDIIDRFAHPFHLFMAIIYCDLNPVFVEMKGAQNTTKGNLVAEIPSLGLRSPYRINNGFASARYQDDVCARIG